MKLSSRARSIPESGTFAVKRRAAELKTQGHDVINLGPGEPDFDTFPEIVQAGKDALDRGFTRYTPSAGLPQLRKAIAKELNQKYGSPFDAENIFISVGGKGALYHLFLALLDEGDEVIVPSPYWVSYPPQVELAGARVAVAPSEDAGFVLSVPILERARAKHTKAAVFSTPSNPTGRVVPKKNLGEMTAWAKDKNVVLISDECYAAYDYEGSFASVASLWSQAPEHLVLAGSFSKSFAMTGWRVGYVAASKSLVLAMSRLQSHTLSGTATMAQAAAVEAFELPKERFAEILDRYRKRRDMVCERLDAMPGVSLEKPDGAFYVFPRVREAMKKLSLASSQAFCEKFLAESHVALIPGECFGAPGYARISYALDEGRLREALERLEAFLRG